MSKTLDEDFCLVATGTLSTGREYIWQAGYGVDYLVREPDGGVDYDPIGPDAPEYAESIEICQRYDAMVERWKAAVYNILEDVVDNFMDENETELSEFVSDPQGGQGGFSSSLPDSEIYSDINQAFDLTQYIDDEIAVRTGIPDTYDQRDLIGEILWSDPEIEKELHSYVATRACEIMPVNEWHVDEGSWDWECRRYGV